MRFGILGALHLDGGVTVTATRDRVVLAMLLLHAGRVVPVHQLIDAIWPEDPPVTARGQLQNCVSRLRRLFADAGLPAGTLATDPAGYLVRLPPDGLDADVFRRLVADARAAVGAGRAAEARRDFRAALGLWRGPALDGITSPAVRGRARALDEQRAVVTEECVDVELGLGLGRDLVDELTGLVEQHPLRERLRGQLLLALCAVGRQADALAVYREGHRISTEELGIEPGPALRDLHRRILDGGVGGPGDDGRPAAPARALPPVTADFTGRDEAVAALVKEIDQANGEAPSVQIIDGMPGSGKTALAVYVATLLGSRYPDAHLFIDLHGHSQRRPVTPGAALDILLRQLGVPSERIPVELDDRVARWRSELTGRRSVIVLDNAASAAQVSPLLPNEPACLTLVTSRRRLVGLDGVRPHPLSVLGPDEAVELLARVGGRQRVRAELDVAAEVVRRCGYLPLAIRMAGARLAHRPRWRLTDLLLRLGGDRPLLAELTAEQRTVSDAFALSYAQLGGPAQRMFRLLGLYPGPHLGGHAAAALAALPLPAARDLLDELVDAHLVEELAADRFRFHDLLREYARGLLAGAHDPADAERARLDLLDLYLLVGARLGRSIEQPTNTHEVPSVARRPDLVETWAEAGPNWFEAERPNLVALVDWAARQGYREYAWRLARAGWRYLYLSGHLDDLVVTHTTGLRVAEELGDDLAVATMQNYLASAYYRFGQFQRVIDSLRVVLGVRRQVGDVTGQIAAHVNLAAPYAHLGQSGHAEEHVRQALALARRDGRPAVLASVLNPLGSVLLDQGRYPEALAAFRNMMLLACAAGDQRIAATAVGNIGYVRARLGEYGPALCRLRVGLRIKRAQGDRANEGEVLNEIGAVELALGRPAEAIARHREALAAMLRGGHQAGACAARNLLGRALLATGDVAGARELHERALRDATRIGSRDQQAQALDGLGACLREVDPAAARAHWERAVVLYRQIHSPHRRDVERQLAGLAAEGDPVPSQPR